ncbi:MAG: hypothetical protein LBU91_08055 [Bacteroidales bacterium]|jgi:hypothetical protein|nr:hypothetical protein [Bacteroidales bacterium]
MKTKTFSLLLAGIISIFGTLLISCNDVNIYPGRAEIVNRSLDYALQDSVIICGYVLSSDTESPSWNRFTIQIVETGMSTQDDSTSYFSMKLLLNDKICTIKCNREFTEEEVPTLKITSILPNEKIEVKFLHKVKER